MSARIKPGAASTAAESATSPVARRIIRQHPSYSPLVKDAYYERGNEDDIYRHSMDAPDRLPMGGHWAGNEYSGEVNVHGWVQR